MKNITRKISFSAALLFALFFALTQITAQDFIETKAAHYVFPDFVKGSVKFKDGNNQLVMLNYNILTEEMVFDNNGQKLAMDQLEKIDTVYIESRKFIPHEKVFYELVVDAPFAFFIQHRGNALSTGTPSGYGGTSETASGTSLATLAAGGQVYKLKLPDEYRITDASFYWIKKNNKYYKANSGRQVAKIFPEKEKEIKAFIKENNIDFKKPHDIKKLVEFINKS